MVNGQVIAIITVDISLRAITEKSLLDMENDQIGIYMKLY